MVKWDLSALSAEGDGASPGQGPLQGGPVLKLICWSPFCRHIIPFILKQHLLALRPSRSHPSAHSFIPLVSVWPWFQLRHYRTDAKVSGQGDKPENIHTHKHAYTHSRNCRVKLERPPAVYQNTAHATLQRKRRCRNSVTLIKCT